MLVCYPALQTAIIWLIAIAMFLSRAVIKTGLGKRIALYFVGRFGKNDGRGLWYGVG